MSAPFLPLLRRRRGGYDAYAVLGYKPALVLDFDDDEYYRANSAATTFSDAITHSASSNATMVDSDGLLKWRPHNLFNYSDGSQAQLLGTDTTDAATPIEGFSNSLYFDGDGTLSLKYWGGIPGGVLLTLSVYVELDSGAEPTFPSQAGAPFAFVVGGVSPSYVSGYNVVHVSGNVYQVSTTMTSGFSGSAGIIQHTNQTLPFKATRWQCYRSDLGGMVNNPDRGDSYVPTTSQAVYLPRRGHHVYNGTSWVNEGLLHESEARTNLEDYSDMSSGWATLFMSVNTKDSEGPDGELTSARRQLQTTDNNLHATLSLTSKAASAITYTFSVFLKAIGGLQYAKLRLDDDTTSNIVDANFDLINGTVSLSANATGSFVAVGDSIEPFENGWYRCSITATSNSATTIRNIIYHLNSNAPADDEVFAGSTSDGLYLYGVQLEEGSTPSSYIPTSGSTVTRAAETLTIPAANLPWPTPNVIGPEQTPAFSTWAGVLTGTWAASGGAYTFTDTVGGQTRPGVVWNQSILTAGKMYQAVIDVASITGATQLRIDFIGLSDVLVGAGQTSFVFVASALAASSGPRIRIEDISTTINDGFSLNSFSVREIDPFSVSIQMQGQLNYADTNSNPEARLVLWVSGANYIRFDLRTDSTRTGGLSFYQSPPATQVASSDTSYSPGINVPYNIASRHGNTFINGATDGTALTANTTPVVLPDLSATDLNLGYDYMGTIRTFRMWDQDLGDTGIEEASA